MRQTIEYLKNTFQRKAFISKIVFLDFAFFQMINVYKKSYWNRQRMQLHMAFDFIRYVVYIENNFAFVLKEKIYRLAQVVSRALK